MYGDAIDKITYWLEKASVAENKNQGDALGLLISYYKTGSLQTWDDYNIAWLAATEGNDYINSFIEVYNDPLGYRGRMKELSRLKISICLKKWKLFRVMLNGLKTILR
jgi:dipeptidyl-peptidase-3